VVISKEPISVRELLKRHPNLLLEAIGDIDQTVTGVSSPDHATPSHAVFLATPKALAQGLNSTAGVLVVGNKFRAEAEAKRGGRTLVISSSVERAMAAVVSAHFLRTPYTNPALKNIHPSAVIGKNCEIAEGVRIGPNAFIGNNVKLAAGVYVGANSVIEDETSIGDGTVIHPLVFIGHSTEIGKNCEINPNSVVGKEGFGYAHDERFNHYRIPHQGRVVLEDDVHLGACVTIDRATFGETRIKTGCKFDNNIHVAHNCEIGRNAIITAGFLMGGSSKIGANFLTGGNTMITGHIEVCDNVQLAATTGVAKSLKEPGQYGGQPLVPLQQFIRTKAALAHLPEMRKQLMKVMKKLGLDDNAKESATD
jgi:UDP-3-O-[3-hydroxymyristoyl] glucosamine N-acyltransferase